MMSSYCCDILQVFSQSSDIFQITLSLKASLSEVNGGEPIGISDYMKLGNEYNIPY